jgi:branched-subunit amino acid ABC-type transport system permease component
MVGMYIFVGLIVVGLVALMVFRSRLGRTDRAEAHRRATELAKEKVK